MRTINADGRADTGIDLNTAAEESTKTNAGDFA
jgi:hypothetical protein